MADKYAYSRDFRLKILALMLDNIWMARYGTDIILPEYFETEDEETVARAIIEYRTNYKRSPLDPEDLIAMTGGNGTIDTIYDAYEIAKERETALAADIAVQFAKEQAAKLAVLESIDDINRGDLKSVRERIKEAMEIGEHLQSPGIDPIRDTDKWLYEYWTNKVRTGWYHVDEALEGGLNASELGILLGPVNRGKSMGLINIAHGAASLGSGVDVAYISHEMPPPQVARRIAARITFHFAKKEDNLEEYENELVEVARKYIPGRIRVIGGHKMSIDEINNNLERLKAEGFNFGLVVDDYPDLIASTRRYNERRFELSSIYEDFRAMLGEHDVPGWGATQGNRGSLSKEIITMADIAEDIGKAAIADVIIALCQTYEEEQANQCRLFMAKVRDGKKKTLFSAKYYGDSQSIITTGIVKPKKERDV